MRRRGFLQYVKVWHAVFLIAAGFLITSYTNAATIHNFKDRITDSAPGESSDHIVEFTTTAAIPPGGYVRFAPDTDFSIPTTTFDVRNVALYVNNVLRSATGTPSAIDDGVSITPGTSGEILITLNSTTGISAGASVRLEIGTLAPNATSSDTGIMNPLSPGSYNYTIGTGGGSESSEVVGKIVILPSVHVGDIDTTESEPPVRFNGAPSGTIAGTVTQVELSLETNEFAKCRYSTASGTPYFSMSNEMNPFFTVVHTKEVTVASGTPYTFFIRCIDDEGNANPDDYPISFIVLPAPSGAPADDPGQEGGGDSGEGTGTGSSGGGSGSSSGGSSGGGSGGGGSSGGNDGGGFESTAKPYQSGDGRVIITGYAFPQSPVFVLVDGVIADRENANGQGYFSFQLDEIARGRYTFGVYAIDNNNVRSSTFSTTFTVTGSRGSTLSNINVMPSIKVTPDPAQPNSTVTFTGYAIPNATVTIENQNDRTSASLKTFTAVSDGRGAWSLSMSTDGFTRGTYKVRAKAKQDVEGGVSTNFSNYTFYGVGENASVPRTSDLNRDGKVNLVDFSILLFWWNTDGGNSNPPADINGDGRVTLTDFSIMIFNWTG